MFLAVLGHDLRGPLAAINMTGKALLMPGLTESARRDAGMRIQRASTAMNRLIVDLLEYTRTRLGSGIPIEKAICDLGSVCEDALETVPAGHPEQRFEEHLFGDLVVAADAHAFSRCCRTSWGTRSSMVIGLHR